MQLQIMDHVIDLVNDENLIAAVESHVNEYLKNNAYYFSHLVVDGVEVYEKFEEYLKGKLIHKVNVILYSSEELQRVVLQDTYDYLNRSIPQLKVLAKEMEKPDTESWNKFTELIDALQWLSDMIQKLGRKEYIAVGNKLDETLSGMLQALEQQDIAIVIDMIYYELLPCFEEWKVQLHKALNSEGKHNDIH